MTLLLDPARSRDSIATLAVDAGLAPADILALYKKGITSEAEAIATGQLATALPDVTKAVIERAIDRERVCLCVKHGIADAKCTKCKGSGLWLQEADIARQQMVWESMGIVKKSGGIQIQQNQMTGVIVPTNFMDGFVKATDQVAYDVKPSDIIDVEK